MNKNGRPIVRRSAGVGLILEKFWRKWYVKVTVQIFSDPWSRFPKTISKTSKCSSFVRELFTIQCHIHRRMISSYVLMNNIRIHYDSECRARNLLHSGDDPGQSRRLSPIARECKQFLVRGTIFFHKLFLLLHATFVNITSLETE